MDRVECAYRHAHEHYAGQNSSGVKQGRRSFVPLESKRCFSKSWPVLERRMDGDDPMSNLELLMAFSASLSIACLLASLWFNDERPA